MIDILARLAHSSENEEPIELKYRCFDAAEKFHRLIRIPYAEYLKEAA